MRTLSVAILAAALSAAAAVAPAGDGCNSCGCPQPIQCPNCQKYCKLSIEKEKVKKHCFNVECEAICIPSIRFPWESCCKPPSCARARLVHVLKKEEYECEHCKCKWTPVCSECGQCGACQKAPLAPSAAAPSKAAAAGNSAPPTQELQDPAASRRSNVKRASLNLPYFNE